MSIKRQSLVLVGLFVVSLGCFFANGQAEAAKSKPIVMKVAHIQPEKTARHQSFLRFKETVEQKSNGEIQIKIFPAAQLGTDKNLLEQVKTGVLQGHRGGAYEVAAKELMIYNMPFLFQNAEGVHKVTRGPVGDEIAAHANKNGIIILATGTAGGLRHFTNNKRPIVKPEDMVGLKMRVPPVDVTIKTMEAIGASPVSIPFTEAYLALKSGVADGQENPYAYIRDAKFYEVQKHITLVNWQYHPEPFSVNLAWYDTLSADHQKILKDAAVEMMIYSDELGLSDAADGKRIIEETMEITELTKEQHQAFVDVTKGVYDYYINEGLFTWDDIKRIRAAAE